MNNITLDKYVGLRIRASVWTIDVSIMRITHLLVGRLEKLNIVQYRLDDMIFTAGQVRSVKVLAQ